MLVIGSLCVYLVACCLEIFGAFKVKKNIFNIIAILMLIRSMLKLLKWLLIPYMTLEFFRLVILSVLHIVGMMVLKSSINLGTLIGVTVFGGFGLRNNFFHSSIVS